MGISENLKIKNVVLKDYDWRPVGIKGVDVINRISDNRENYVTVTGTKSQINKYLQDKPILSDRLRTLNNVPKFRLVDGQIRKGIY